MQNRSRPGGVSRCIARPSTRIGLFRFLGHRWWAALVRGSSSLSRALRRAQRHLSWDATASLSQGRPPGFFCAISIRALLTPPTLGERSHRGLARRRVAVRRRAILDAQRQASTFKALLRARRPRSHDASDDKAVGDCAGSGGLTPPSPPTEQTAANQH